MKICPPCVTFSLTGVTDWTVCIWTNSLSFKKKTIHNFLNRKLFYYWQKKFNKLNVCNRIEAITLKDLVNGLHLDNYLSHTHTHTQLVDSIATDRSDDPVISGRAAPAARPHPC